MTYYEELGISADAAEEEIRQAHRRLVKLLHPDRQMNQELRRMAELQMIRVNALVEQLLDPTQRKLYDLAIRAPLPNYNPPMPKDVPREAILKSWKYAGAGLAVAMVAWIFTASSPTDVIRSVTAGVMPGTASGSEAIPAPKTMPTQVAKPPLRAVIVPPQRAPVAAASIPDRAPAAVEVKPVDNASSAAPHLVTNPEPVPPVMPASSESKPSVLAAQQTPTLSGVWLYAGGKRTSEDESLYKPEYIELRIVDEAGVLHGEYRSRYAVTDLPISPAVNFSFHGSTASASTLPWKGPKGSSGTVVLKLLNKNAMQVDWKVADAGDSGIGLEFGTAILIRRL